VEHSLTTGWVIMSSLTNDLCISYLSLGIDMLSI